MLEVLLSVVELPPAGSLVSIPPLMLRKSGLELLLPAMAAAACRVHTTFGNASEQRKPFYKSAFSHDPAAAIALSA
jgi:hypothetical protein